MTTRTPHHCRIRLLPFAQPVQKEVATNGSVALKWTRPEGTFHAHFDCFSGAAGDMMLAACLDAASDAAGLLSYIQHALEQGIPEIKGEFQISQKRVWRSKMGSIAANSVVVESLFRHEVAPVPVNANEESHEDAIETRHAHSHGQVLHQIRTALTDHDNSHAHRHTHDDESQKGPLRDLPTIRRMLLEASHEFIPDWVKNVAIDAFTSLAEAEASTHGAASMDSVHFHEVGAIDSIVDTVGTCLALWCLGVTTVSCSRLPLGEGTVVSDHGLLPVPAPATLRLMVGMATCPGPPGVTGELVTPTAAALLKVLTWKAKTPDAEQKSCSTKRETPVGRPPPFHIRRVGIGAGSKDFDWHPNILRVMIGDRVVIS